MATSSGLSSAVIEIAIVPLTVCAAYGIFIWYRLRTARRIAEKLVSESKPYNLTDALRERRLLVFGDSTAVGVGCKGEQTVAGRLGEYLHVNVENYAASGATTKDIADQMAKAWRGHYDLVLIQVGANDIMSRRSLALAGANLDGLVQYIGGKSERVVVMTAGDIGNAPLFLWPLNWIVSYRTRILRRIFMEVCARRGAVYVDLYAEPDIFHLDRKRYYTKDGLHISGDAYEYWFEILKTYLDKWPELRHSGVQH